VSPVREFNLECVLDCQYSNVPIMQCCEVDDMPVSRKSPLPLSNQFMEKRRSRVVDHDQTVELTGQYAIRRTTKKKVSWCVQQLLSAPNATASPRSLHTLHTPTTIVAATVGAQAGAQSSSMTTFVIIASRTLVYNFRKCPPGNSISSTKKSGRISINGRSFLSSNSGV
jgi:hypothetical protein